MVVRNDRFSRDWAETIKWHSWCMLSAARRGSVDFEPNQSSNRITWWGLVERHLHQKPQPHAALAVWAPPMVCTHAFWAYTCWLCSHTGSEQEREEYWELNQSGRLPYLLLLEWHAQQGTRAVSIRAMTCALSGLRALTQMELQNKLSTNILHECPGVTVHRQQKCKATNLIPHDEN